MGGSRARPGKNVERECLGTWCEQRARIGQCRGITRRASMEQWECLVCGYIYDPGEGDSYQGVEPGTAFEDLPDDWLCPDCGVGREMFEKLG
jgi:rubredoxin